ncbi:MAG: DNA repair protein RecO [Planctomycetia bacterium]
MAAEKTRAIVLRATPFGDTSSVVTLLTRDCGKLRALAKGAWRPKSSFDGALDLLSNCQVLVLRKSSGGLDLVTEAFLEHRFRVGRSRAAFLGGMHLAELLDGLTAEGDPLPELFDVATSTLRILSAPVPTHETPHDPSESGSGHPASAGGQGGADQGSAVPAPHVREGHVRLLIARAELAILRIVGHAPSLDHCAECQGPVAGGRRFSFGMLDGGLLCGRCRGGKRSVVAISADCLTALRTLAGAADGWRRLSLAPSVDGEVHAVMTTLLSHLLGRRLRVASLLQPRRRPAGGPARPDTPGSGPT